MGLFGRFVVALALGALSGSVLPATTTRSSSFAYDAGGLLIKEVIEPGSSTLCVVTTHGYDVWGNKTLNQTRNCDGSTGEAAPPAVGSDAVIDLRESAVTFDAKGRFQVSATNAEYHTETRVFDARYGGVTSLTGPNALITAWAYDEFGRKTLETRSDGNKTEFSYVYCSGVAGGTAVCPPNAKYVVVSTPKSSAGVVNGAVSKGYFDVLNREIRAETEGFSGTLVYKDTQYDAFGRVSQVSKPYYSGTTAQWTVFAYDVVSRVTTETQPAATAGTIRTATVYSVNTAGGITTSVTVSNNGSGTNMPQSVTQSKTIVKNSQGQTLSSTDAQGNVVSHTYDPFGNLLTTNAGGIVTTMGYDTRGRKTSMADPDMGTWTYAYDAVGQLKRQTTARGHVSTTQYDRLGRMTARVEPDLSSTWGYDWCAKGKGKLCDSDSNNGYVRNLYYDGQGRLSQVSTSLDTFYVVSYAYDANGRLSQITYPENTVYPANVIVKNVHNTRGYLSQVTNAAGTTVYWAANTMSATGKVLTETLGNGATTNRVYDALDRMTSSVVAKSGVNLQSVSYTYDVIGNLAQRVDAMQSNLTENFAYDNLNRLLQSSGTGLTTKSYSYNAVGNMTYKSDGGTYNYPAAASPRPHAVSSVTGTVNGFLNPAFSYDANGNMLTGLGRTITYTSYDMPSTVNGVRYAGGPSYSYTYTYNAEHERMRLVHSTLGTFIYLHPDGKGQLLYEKETRPSGVVEHKNYISAGGLPVAVILNRSDGTSETRYFHTDRLGSVTTVTNSTGGVMERLAYDAFGKRRLPAGGDNANNSLFATTTDRGFTGHEHLDEIALIHMNGRVYDPALARFVSADPHVEEPSNLQSYNRYSYVDNNPLTYTDPSGYFKLKDLKKWWRPIAAVAVAYFTGYIDFNALAGGSIQFLSSAGVAQSMAGGFAGGLVAGNGDIKVALQSALTAGAFNLAGATFANDPFGQVASHAAIGCASSAAGGGSCGAGALSAGVAKFATQQLVGIKDLGDFGRGVAVTVIGGTASVLGGGKFENGAVTAAFAYLFNQLSGKQLAGLAKRGLLFMTRELAEYGYTLIGSEVTFVGESGTRIRIDGVYIGPDGRLLFGEAKVGDHADLSRNQKSGLPELQAGKGTFVGGNAEAIASRLNLQVDASGRFTVDATKIQGVYAATYERNTPETQRMKALNDALKSSGGAFKGKFGGDS